MLGINTIKNNSPLFILLFCMLAIILLSCTPQRQKLIPTYRVPDTNYTKVMEIGNRDILKVGKMYFFIPSIPEETENPVLFISERVPSDLLDEIYPEFKKLTVITPNWKFYDEQPTSKGEPIASSIIYHLNRENEKLVKDSMVIMGGFPKMEFKKTSETANLKTYYNERYGSVCCPRDEKWDLKPSLEDFVKDFELKNKVKITGTYLEPYGKEGEVNYYFQLTGLSNLLKFKFTTERYAQVLGKKPLPQIFTPTALVLHERMYLMDK